MLRFFTIFALLWVGQAQALELIAHRGLHQNWYKGSYSRIDGCEAKHMMPPTHHFIENTRPSIQAAFTAGATMVEVDIRRTRDNHLVLMHDFDLSCKTDGKGLVTDTNLTDLRKLDLGYGFTHDKGKSFPSRGKGLGLLITLPELLKIFPDKKFLLDHKDGSMETSTLMGKVLSKLPIVQQKNILLWTGPGQEKEVQKYAPSVKRLFPGRSEMKTCLMPYMTSGGKKDFGTSCQNMALGLNRDWARLTPGFPSRFLPKAVQNNNPLYWMVDSVADFNYFQKLPTAGLITDWIEVIGPLVKK